MIDTLTRMVIQWPTILSWLYNITNPTPITPMMWRRWRDFRSTRMRQIIQRYDNAGDNLYYQVCTLSRNYYGILFQCSFFPLSSSNHIHGKCSVCSLAVILKSVLSPGIDVALLFAKCGSKSSAPSEISHTGSRALTSLPGDGETEYINLFN